MVRARTTGLALTSLLLVCLIALMMVLTDTRQAAPDLPQEDDSRSMKAVNGLLDADRLQTQDMSSEDSRNRVGEKLKMMKSIVPKTVELPTLAFGILLWLIIGTAASLALIFIVRELQSIRKFDDTLEEEAAQLLSKHS